MRVNSINFLLLLQVIFLLSGCNKDLDRKEFVGWYNSTGNPNQKTREIGEYIYQLKYTPPEHIILSEDSEVSKEELEVRKKELDDMVYFTLNISMKNKSKDPLMVGIKDQQEYGERQNYFAFRFQENIFLESGDKREPCQSFHYLRSYDLGSERTFLLGFDKKSAGEEFTIVVDPDYLRTGPVKINFSQQEIQKFPKLKIS